MKLDDELRAAIRGQLTALPKSGRKSRDRRCDAWRTGLGVRSDALGVGIEQIPRARAELAKMGVNCDFDPRTGAAIVTSSHHYRQVAKASGLFCGRDGFGVPNPEEVGGYVGTGRGQQKGKEEFRKKIHEELDSIP